MLRAGLGTAQVCDLWKSVWAGQAGRVHCVMGSQAANSWTASQALNCPLWSQGPCATHGIDAVAIAPYFGGYLGHPSMEATVEGWTAAPDGGLQMLFDELDPAALNQAYGWVDDNRVVVDSFGIDLLAYGGGRHLAGFLGVENNTAITTLFTTASRDPRMGSLYDLYLDGWNQHGGGLFMHLTDIGAYSKWGSWGAMETLHELPTPKYSALAGYVQTGNELIMADGFESSAQAAHVR